LGYEITDRARSILVGVITAAICGIVIYVSSVHLPILGHAAPLGSQAADQGRGSAHGGELRQAAGIAAPPVDRSAPP